MKYIYIYSDMLYLLVKVLNARDRAYICIHIFMNKEHIEIEINTSQDKLKILNNVFSSLMSRVPLGNSQP